MLTDNYLDKFKVVNSNPIFSLAEEIEKFFNGKLSKGFVMGWIGKVGLAFVREQFEEIRKSEPDNKLTLFKWRLKNAKVNWYNEKKVP